MANGQWSVGFKGGKLGEWRIEGGENGRELKSITAYRIENFSKLCISELRRWQPTMTVKLPSQHKNHPYYPWCM